MPARSLLVAALAAAAVAAHAAGPARGLIVRLKDAPAHEAAQALRGAPPADAARWRRVFDEAVLAPRSMRPAGRAAQWLDFGRTLEAAEASELAERLRARPDVAWVVPNERERLLQTVPDDPGYLARAGSGFTEPQWWLQTAAGGDANALADRRRGVPGFETAWLTSTGSPAVIVAVLDTGITTHPELAGRVLPGYDFVSTVEFANDGGGRDADASDPGDWVLGSDLSNPAFRGCDEQASSWHGTIIAGLVGAATNNGSGVAGIVWDARVLPVRVAGKCGAEVVDIVDGMRWAAGLFVDGAPANPNPARIVNISFGGSEPCNQAYQEAIDELLGAGTIVVAAAGNERGTPSRPANCANVLGVAALNRDGFKATYSNFGPAIALAAVGGDPASQGNWGSLVGDSGMLSIDNAGTRQPGAPTYSYLAGTSFAAPLVAGAASLMLSVNPALSASQLIAALRASVRPHVTSPHIGACSAANPGRCLCTTATCGAGILDAARALQAAQGLTPSPLSAAVLDNDELRRAAANGPDSAAMPVTPPATTNGGGGGALDPAWLAALLFAAALLAAQRRGR